MAGKRIGILLQKIACADEFITKKRTGLPEPVAQGGANLSGGQRQRLAIARALMKKAGNLCV